MMNKLNNYFLHTLPCAVVCALTLAGVGMSGAAHAALGAAVNAGAQDVPNTPSQAQALVARSASAGAYTRHSLALAGGGQAMEYADGAGRVFAVTWRAPVMPDMTALLGTYKTQLDTAQQAAPTAVRSLHQLHAENGDWVMVSGGYLRAFFGYSYLRSALPAGFDLSQLSHLSSTGQ